MSRDTTTVEVIGLVVNLDAAVSGSPTCLAEPYESHDCAYLWLHRDRATLEFSR
jgi:hypothetical protein